MRLRRRGRFLVDDEFEEADLPGERPDAAAARGRRGDPWRRRWLDCPDATRSVIWLYHAEGYTHEEIAAAMGKSISFSKSQLARGTRKLRGLLHLDPEVTAHG